MKPLKSYLPLCAVALMALVWSWNEPLLSSHSFRQAETAQMAQVFLQDGWTPLVTHMRFIGEPGIAVLEFPIYQSLLAGLTRSTRLPLENAGRLLSWLSALALALACAMALRGIHPYLESAGSSMPLSIVSLFVFSSPLVFATSQWVTIELMNAAFAAWAFVLFGQLLQERRTMNEVILALSFGATALISLLMKPHGLFAIFPLFLWRFGQDSFRLKADSSEQRRFLFKTLLLIFLSFAVIVTAAAWYRYSDRINELTHSPFSVAHSKSRLMFGEFKIWQPYVLARLAGRFALYVVGPGSAVFFAVLALWKRAPIGKHRLLFAGVCFMSVAIYLAVFTGANYIHNYYQVAAVFPLYLGLFVLLPWPSKGWVGILAAAAIMVNLVVSVRTLARQDDNWKQMLAYLRTQLPSGYDKPTIKVISNWGASAAVLSYSLERRTLDEPMALVKKSDVDGGLWLGVCDSREAPPCSEIFEHQYAKKPSKVFGPLSVFIPEPLK